MNPPSREAMAGKLRIYADWEPYPEKRSLVEVRSTGNNLASRVSLRALGIGSKMTVSARKAVNHDYLVRIAPAERVGVAEGASEKVFPRKNRLLSRVVTAPRGDPHPRKSASIRGCCLNLYVFAPFA